MGNAKKEGGTRSALVKGKKGKGKRSRGNKEYNSTVAHDVYEEDVRDEDVNNEGAYELPENFEDEEIDSDEAFSSETEEKYGDMFSAKKKKGKRRRIEKPSVESDESDFDDADAVDLSSMLQKGAESPPHEGVESYGDMDGSTGEDDEEFYDDSEEDEGNNADDRHHAMLSAITAKPAGKRNGKSKKEVVHEALEEGEFNVRSGKSSVGVDALLGALKDSAAFGGLKKKLATMERKNLRESKPAAKVHVEKATRAVAYDQAKEAVSKWAPLVKARRELEHLSFPLNRDSEVLNSSNSELTSKFNPATQLEMHVASVIDRAGSAAADVGNGELTVAEELELREITPEEREARVKELRKLRAMESFYAAKCKRVKKIKSKKYHRLKKKDKKRALEKMTPEQLAGMDPEAAKNAVEKAEKARALNRASLRHKNTSKWAKHMLGRSHVDGDTKRAISEQLEIDKELRKKVTLEDSDGDSEANSDDEPNPEGMDDALKEVESMREELKSAEAPARDGLYGLKFMQRALAKKKAEAEEALDDLEAELNGAPNKEIIDTGRRKFGKSSAKIPDVFKPAEWEDDDIPGDEKKQDPSVCAAPPTSGGKKTSVSAAISVQLSNKQAFERPVAKDDAIKLTVDSENHGTVDSGKTYDDVNGQTEEKTMVLKSSEVDAAGAVADNPWMQASQDKAGLTPQIVMNKFTHKAQKREQKLQRNREQDGAKRSKNANVGVAVELSAVDSTLNKAKQTPSSQKKEVQEEQVFALNVSDSSEQKQLIEQAFAGDNVVEQEFEDEKSKLVDDETNKDVDVTLPGWGSWGGSGVAAAPKRRFIKKAEPQADRKDKKLKHVIITERKDKKLERKKVSNLPYPYNNTQQFERTIRQPVGKEWNTSKTSHELTTPKVSTKAGSIITPMSITKSVKAVGKTAS